jgi:excisionase family DNA binding protein
MSRLLRVSDVAALCGVSPWTVRRWMREGRGPEFLRSPGGRDYLFREEDIGRWLDDLKARAAIRGPESKDQAQAAA